MIRYNNSVVNQMDDPKYGNAGIGSTVTVRNASNGAKVDIFADSDGATQLDNPFTIEGNNGNYGFYADGGVYQIVINEGLASEFIVDDVLLSEADLIPLDNVDAMKALSPADGQRRFKCDRYYSGGDLVAGLEYYRMTPAEASAAGVTADGYVNHSFANGDVAVLVHDGALTLEQAGATAGDISLNLTAAIKSNTKLTAKSGSIYSSSGTVSVSGVDNFSIFGDFEINFPDIDGGIVFTNCESIEINDVTLSGNETRATWDALSVGERSNYQPIIEFDNIDGLSYKGVKCLAKRSGAYFKNINDLKIESPYHLGCFGVFSDGRAPNPNWGYALIIENCPDTSIVNPVSEQSGGAVLIRFSTVGVKSFGGYGRDLHDNGFYGSSANNGICEGFQTYDSYSACVKWRGNNNVIKACYAENCTNEYAFILTGIPLDSAKDSKGAVGHGGGIFDCTADNCDALLSVRFTSENGPLLYMRDVNVSGNIGINLTGTSNVPIEVYGVEGMTVTGNRLSGYATSYGLIMQGESSAIKMDNSLVSSNNISDGDNGMRLTYVKNSIADGNVFNSLSDTYTIDTVDCENISMSLNKSENELRRIDLRGSVDCRAMHNSMTVIADAGQLNCESNYINPTVDVSTVVPTRVGQIVQNGTGDMYISNGNTSTANWIAI